MNRINRLPARQLARSPSRVRILVSALAHDKERSKRVRDKERERWDGKKSGINGAAIGEKAHPRRVSLCLRPKW